MMSKEKLNENAEIEEQTIGNLQALNKIVMDLLHQQKQQNKMLCIVLILSLVFNLCTVLCFLYYESQFEYVTTQETSTLDITQDTGEGSGNNIYQSGENASYTQNGGVSN